jgi:cupin 2 domain-containing protein
LEYYSLSYERANIFDEIPIDLKEEVFSVIANKGSVRIERIVSLGHSSPNNFWYDQKGDEFVILLSGGATIEFEDSKTVDLEPGDYLLIPAHTKHRVLSTDSDEESVWLAVHF